MREFDIFITRTTYHTGVNGGKESRARRSSAQRERERESILSPRSIKSFNGVDEKSSSRRHDDADDLDP